MIEFFGAKGVSSKSNLTGDYNYSERMDESNSGMCNIRWQSIAGDGDCPWTSITTALVKEQRPFLDDADHKWVPYRVTMFKVQTFDFAIRLIAGLPLLNPTRKRRERRNEVSGMAS